MKKAIFSLLLLTSLNSFASVTIDCVGKRVVDFNTTQRFSNTTEHFLSEDVSLRRGRELVHTFKSGARVEAEMLNPLTDDYRVVLKINESIQVGTNSVGGLLNIKFRINSDQYEIECKSR